MKVGFGVFFSSSEGGVGVFTFNNASLQSIFDLRASL